MTLSTRNAAGWIGLLAVVAFGLWSPVSTRAAEERPIFVAPGADLSGYSASTLARPLRALFIHHSCGGQWLADPGNDSARAPCILDKHPNAGGLRAALRANGYEVHEASYGSEVGEKTDLFDWTPKFRSQMNQILRVDENDRLLPEGTKHEIVIFKSCYPNSDFEGEGSAPGDPKGPALTVQNAEATLRALREELEKHPEVLFVYVTAPPLAPPRSREPLWKALARTLAPGSKRVDRAARAAWAREFNNWVKAPDGWLAGYVPKNIVVFDYFDVLTDGGRSNFLRFPTGDGTNSHPSREGNSRASEAFVPFLNRAVRRAGLSP